MMPLNAISVGYAIPKSDFTASVHSVFRSAVNLQPSGERLLYTLVASGEADLPQGIRLDTPPEFSFEQAAAGEGVTSRDGYVRFETSSLTIDMHPARRWRCDLPALMVNMADPHVADAWGWVWKVLRERRPSGMDTAGGELLPVSGLMSGEVDRKLDEALRRLVKITRQYDLSGISSVCELIGLGIGLTPSGDDILVGYLTGLWCAVRDREERKQFISSLGEMVTRLSDRTNDISRTYLHHAARGQVSSRLSRLAEAISRGETAETLLPIIEAAMQVGHTSGRETVFGLLVGLAAWGGAELLKKIGWNYHPN